MSLYDVETDIYLDVLLESAVPPPACEWITDNTPGGPECGAPATWILSLSCGHSAYYDDVHHEAIDSYLRAPGENACRDERPPRHKPLTIFTHVWSRIDV